MKKELTIQEVLNSKTYIKKNSAMKFSSPSEYINPFIDQLSHITTDFKCYGILGSVNMNEDGETNEAYSRILVEANMPAIYNIEGNNDKERLNSKVGFIYALDTQKPVIKTFSGKDVKACLNLTIFNAEHLFSQDLTGNSKLIYNMAKKYAEEMQETNEKFREEMQILINKTYAGSELNEFIGELLRKSLQSAKLGHTPIIQGVKELALSSSPYKLIDGTTTGWNLYNAITQHLESADIADRSQKTVILSSLFLN